MNRFSKQKQFRLPMKELLLPLLLFGAMMGFFWFGMESISKTTEQESIQSAKQAVIRSAVNCYAIEGEYPGSLSYLEDNYGLTLNRDKYIIDYECFASNIMPTVTVLPKKVDRLSLPEPREKNGMVTIE